MKVMERMDSTYATLKKESADLSKSPEERTAAADELAQQESLLQPTYTQIALLYADLHE